MSRLTAEPAFPQNANAGQDVSRQVMARLLLNHRPVIQIESSASVTGTSGPGAYFLQPVEVRGMPAVKRNRDIPLPPHET